MSSAERRRAGFTLIELLVAVVMSAILATVIFQMVRGQSRFTQMQSAREEVDQNTRGALELITSELRAVPSAGIVSAGADRITVRLPRVWGLLCTPATSTKAVAIFPPGTVPATFTGTSAADMSENKSWGIAIQNKTQPLVYASYTVTATAGAQEAVCTPSMGAQEPGLDAALVPESRAFTYSSSLLPPSSETGGRVFLYETITYDAASSSTDAVTGVWLRRSQGVKTIQQQPLAGPMDTRDSAVPALSFRYFCNGAQISSGLLATEAGRQTITAVEVQVGMMSREATRSVQQVERDTLLIHLRNTGTVTCI